MGTENIRSASAAAKAFVAQAAAAFLCGARRNRPDVTIGASRSLAIRPMPRICTQKRRLAACATSREIGLMAGGLVAAGFGEGPDFYGFGS